MFYFKIHEKCIFNFEIHTQKDKNKKDSTFIWNVFAVPFFCIINLKIHEKDKNAKKNKIFKFEKYISYI